MLRTVTLPQFLTVFVLADEFMRQMQKLRRRGLEKVKIASSCSFKE